MVNHRGVYTFFDQGQIKFIRGQKNSTHIAEEVRGGGHKTLLYLNHWLMLC